MTSRQAGRRISTIAAKRKTIGRPRRGGSRQTPPQRKSQALSPRERKRLVQLVACGSVFVLLVAVKLLLPEQMARLNAALSRAMEQNIDVQAVFSAVGGVFTGEEDVGDSLEDVYQAVFHPQEAAEAAPAAAAGGLGGEVAAPVRLAAPGTLDTLRSFREGSGDSGAWLAPPGRETPPGEVREPATEELAYVLYSEQNLPENVSLEQALLGFDYCTPVMGTLSSGFGYREHPVEGEERFHYGIDIAADTGTPIGCFADGTITAVGESSSFGKYLIVGHEGGYSTLYAHCSKITVSSGAAVRQGQTIAEVGDTGMATGPHLHLELQKGNDYLNPIYYVSLV